MTLLTFVILALASYRVTRFLLQDELFDTPRDWLYTQFEGHPKLTYLLGCAWCLGFWVSVFMVGLLWAIPSIAPWILAPFALSAIVGLIDQKAN